MTSKKKKDELNSQLKQRESPNNKKKKKKCRFTKNHLIMAMWTRRLSAVRHAHNLVMLFNWKFTAHWISKLQYEKYGALGTCHGPNNNTVVNSMQAGNTHPCCHKDLSLFSYSRFKTTFVGKLQDGSFVWCYASSPVGETAVHHWHRDIIIIINK